MIKKLLTDQEYTITSTSTIKIDSTIKFEAKNLSLILVTASNKIVYNFACDDKKATVSGQTITLVDERILTTDLLTIIMTFEEGSEIERLDDILLWNKRVHNTLVSIVEQQTETNKLLKKIYNHE